MFHAVYFALGLVVLRFGNHDSVGHRAPAVLWVQALDLGEISVRIALWPETLFGRRPQLALGLLGRSYCAKINTTSSLSALIYNNVIAA